MAVRPADCRACSVLPTAVYTSLRGFAEAVAIFRSTPAAVREAYAPSTPGSDKAAPHTRYVIQITVKKESQVHESTQLPPTGSWTGCR